MFVLLLLLALARADVVTWTMDRTSCLAGSFVASPPLLPPLSAPYITGCGAEFGAEIAYFYHTDLQITTTTDASANLSSFINKNFTVEWWLKFKTFPLNPDPFNLLLFDTTDSLSNSFSVIISDANDKLVTVIYSTLSNGDYMNHQIRGSAVDQIFAGNDILHIIFSAGFGSRIDYRFSVGVKDDTLLSTFGFSSSTTGKLYTLPGKTRIGVGGRDLHPFGIPSTENQNFTLYRFSIYNTSLSLAEHNDLHAQDSFPVPAIAPTQYPTTHAPSRSPSFSPSRSPTTGAPTTRLTQCAISAPLLFHCAFPQEGELSCPYFEIANVSRETREGFSGVAKVGVIGTLLATGLPSCHLLSWGSEGFQEGLVSGDVVIGGQNTHTLGLSAYDGTLSPSELSCLSQRIPRSLPVVKQVSLVVDHYFFPEFFDADGDPITSFLLTRWDGSLFSRGTYVSSNETVYSYGDRLQVRDTSVIYVRGEDGYGGFGPEAAVHLTLLPPDEDDEDLTWTSLRTTSRPPRTQYTLRQSECLAGSFTSRNKTALLPYFDTYANPTPPSCTYSPGFHGAIRQGVFLSDENTELASSTGIKEDVNYLSGPLKTGYQFSIEMWVTTEDVTPMLPPRVIYMTTVSSGTGIQDTHFLATVYSRMEYLMYLDDAQDYVEVVVDNGTCRYYDLYEQEVGTYHVVLTGAIINSTATSFVHQSTSYYTKNGVTSVCNITREKHLTGSNLLSFTDNNRLSLSRFSSGLNAHVRSLSIYDYALSKDEIFMLAAVGPPNSIPVPAVNLTVFVYEDLISLVNTSFSFYDDNGDSPLFVIIHSLPLYGALTYSDGSSFELPAWIPYGTSLLYSPDQDAFGCIGGVSITLSDDGLSHSPVPGNVSLCIVEVNDPPQPSHFAPLSITRWQSSSFTLGFSDPDDSVFDALGDPPLGAMTFQGLLRPGAYVTFAPDNIEFIKFAPACSAQVPHSTPLESGDGMSFTFCFNASGIVGDYVIKYNFTDPANLTGSPGNASFSILSPLISCPSSPITRPAHLQPCISYDSFVYLEGKDVNTPLSPVSFRITRLPLGFLYLNGPSPTLITSNASFSSSLIPNLVYTAPFYRYTASSEGVFTDLAGGSLLDPDFFEFQVLSDTEGFSLVYKYTLHSIPPLEPLVSIGFGQDEVYSGSVLANVSSSAGDIRALRLNVRVYTGRIRLRTPYATLKQASFELPADLADIGRFAVQEIEFTAYPSLANEILTGLEFQQPNGGVRNGSSTLRITAYSADTLASLAIGSVPLVGNRVITIPPYLAEITAAIFVVIATASIFGSCCFAYLILVAVCR